jgi:hypothetical protein
VERNTRPYTAGTQVAKYLFAIEPSLFTVAFPRHQGILLDRILKDKEVVSDEK